MKKQLCWAQSGGEVWLGGPFDSVPEALDWLADRGYEAELHYVRRPVPGDYLPSASDLCESLDESAHDDGLLVEAPLFVVPDEKKEQAEAELKAWADRWIEIETPMFVGSPVPMVPTP